MLANYHNMKILVIQLQMIAHTIITLICIHREREERDNELIKQTIPLVVYYIIYLLTKVQKQQHRVKQKNDQQRFLSKIN
jgi:hypothetical protein